MQVQPPCPGGFLNFINIQFNDTNRDRALFARIADGDEAAFEELFNIYVPQLHRIIFNLVPSETSVKDIAQEVFLHLWLGRDKLHVVEEPQHWIFRIAYNQSFKHLKRQEQRQRRFGGELSEDDMAATNETQEAIDVAEVSRLIQHAVETLPEQPQRIYRMNRVEGLKPAEIAEALAISTQGVRNSLTRSAKQIREYLARHGIHIPLILILLHLP